MDEISEGSILLSFNGIFSMMAIPDVEVTTEKLRQIADEIVHPTRFNKSYHSALNRPELKDFLNGLADHLEKKGLKRFTYEDLRAAGILRVNEAKKKGEVGECYALQSFGGPRYIFGNISRPQNVSPENQEKIESLMKNGQNREYHFGDVDTKLYKNNRLTIEELKELKALRNASAVFEQSTFLKNDDAGGFISNLKGELLGGDQLNCALEAHNHTVFIQKLKINGLLKYFSVDETVTRPMKPSKKDLTGGGHVAVVLKNNRTGESFVYDSWFEKGGDHAHILTMEDWKNLSLDFKNDFKDVVPLN